MEEYGDEVFEKLSKGAHIYFCGLKGMMPGILKMLEKVAKSKKMNWETTLKDLKKAGEVIYFTPEYYLFVVSRTDSTESTRSHAVPPPPMHVCACVLMNPACVLSKVWD